jgi:glycosyltransferase involved in cell wall biosynthesis
MFPQCNHVELFIGYPDFPFNAWRCFESECWRHYHWGRDDAKPEFQGNRGLNKMYSAVVPNFYDLADWDLGDGSGDYVLFMGRICAEKGINTILDIIKAWFQDVKKGEREPVKFVFAGQGDYENLVRIPLSGLGALLTSHIEYRGVVQDRDRSDLIGKARCMLMPTNFIEPLGGAGVESQLCGTPLVAVNYGAFTETINHGVSGFRCNTIGDWLSAVKYSASLDRSKVAHWARSRYSLEACAPQFHAFLMQISDLWRAGWYEKESYRVPCYAGEVFNHAKT